MVVFNTTDFTFKSEDGIFNDVCFAPTQIIRKEANRHGQDLFMGHICHFLFYLLVPVFSVAQVNPYTCVQRVESV